MMGVLMTEYDFWKMAWTGNGSGVPWVTEEQMREAAYYELITPVEFEEITGLEYDPDFVPADAR